MATAPPTDFITRNLADQRAEKQRDDERIAFLIALLLLHRRFDILIKSVYAEIQTNLTGLVDSEGKLTRLALFNHFVGQRMQFLAGALLQDADDGLRHAAIYGRDSAIRRYEKESGKQAEITDDESAFVALVVGLILQRGSHGYPLAASLADVATGVGLDIQAAARRASILGESATDAAKRIDEILLTGKNSFARRVESLADTEANGAYNEAVKQEAPKLGVLIGFRWVLSAAHKDQGGKEVCEQFAGKVYHADDEAIALYPPHKNCQCRLIPVYDPKEFANG